MSSCDGCGARAWEAGRCSYCKSPAPDRTWRAWPEPVTATASCLPFWLLETEDTSRYMIETPEGITWIPRPARGRD